MQWKKKFNVMSRIHTLKLSVFILLFFVVYTTKAQEEQPLSLKNAIGISLENNFGITIQEQQVAISQRQNNWGAAGALPTVTFVGEGGVSQSMDSDLEKTSTTQRASASVNLNWTLFRGFSARIQKERLEKLEELTKGNLTLIVENTMVQVIATYYQLQLLQQQLTLAEEVMTLSYDRYMREMERKELGSSTTYALLQSQNAYLEDKSNFLSLGANYKVSLRQLNYLMGADLALTYDLQTPLQAITSDYDLQVLTDRLMANNNTLQNQYIGLSLARNSVESARSAFYPTLSAGVSTGYNQSTTAFEQNQPDVENDGFSAGANVTLSYTFYTGGTRRQALDVARMQQAISEVETTDMEWEMRKQLAQEFDLYSVRKELLSVAQENYEAAELNYQISQDKFNSGAISSFNFRDVQQMFLNAGLRLTEARYNTTISYYTLLRLTGGLLETFEPETAEENN